jgi:hypothetical protein
MKYAEDIIRTEDPEDRAKRYGLLREQDRLTEWHRTFNAAITGLVSRWTDIPTTPDQIVWKAKEIADAAHGILG